MTRKGDKQELPLHLDMDFGEALARFAGTDPKQVDESVKRSKQKKSRLPVEAPGKSVARTKGDKGGQRRRHDRLLAAIRGKRLTYRRIGEASIA